LTLGNCGTHEIRARQTGDLPEQRQRRSLDPSIF
jgi:hypothetical protein